MSVASGSASERELRFQEVVAEYLEAREAGRPEGLSALLTRHPDLADEIAAFVAGQDEVARLAAPLRDAVAPATLPEQTRLPATLGDFRIVREVGRGGMGIVYEAEQVSLGRRVALKVLPFAATMDPRQLQRFHNEARAAAGLHHTNIVPVFGVGSERGVHYYAMQFIDGCTLADLITEQRGGSPSQAPTVAEAEAAASAATVPPAAQATSAAPRDAAYFRRVAEWGIQAAEALDCAHTLGVVHRDIKPANLLVDLAGRLWVTDFGLARVQSDARLTMTGDLVGTLRYMSPEQALAKRVVIDHRTDVYSLGTTLYELLALRPAFEGGDRQELLRQIAFEEPRRLRRLDRAIPAELETIVLKAMEKDPQDRYATAQELADDLRHWLEDRPIRARRPSWRQVAARWARRHKPMVWSAAVVFLVTALVGGSTWLWWAHKRGRAEEAVRTALAEAAEWRQQEKWPEGLSAVRRADEILATVGADPALRQQVAQAGKDLEMARRLEELHVLAGGGPAGYADAFLWFGLDVENLDAEAAARIIRASSIGPQLAEGLDYWAMNCEAPERRKHLLAIARITDPDPWRDRLRDALEKGDGRALQQITSSAAKEDLPPATALLLLKYAQEVGASERAVRSLYKVQQRNPANFRVNMALAYGCFDLSPRQLTEALCYFRAAVALRPDSCAAHMQMAVVLSHMGRPDEDIAEWREVIRLDKSNVSALSNLGADLAQWGRGGEREEGVAMCREAALRVSNSVTHFNLACALLHTGQLDEAISEYRLTDLLQKQLPPHPHRKGGCHVPLGVALARKGLWGEALVEFREAVRIDKDDPVAQYWLGTALLDARLPKLLTGEDRPAGTDERLALAQLCQTHKQLYAASVRWYGEAFAAQPALAEDPRSNHRYNAACAAALAGCGQGKDADSLDDKKRASLRRKALDWLRADLTAWDKLLEKEADKSRPAILKMMPDWLADADFAGVRGPEALAKLPDAERQPWRQLWGDVADLLARAQNKAAPEKKPGAK